MTRARFKALLRAALLGAAVVALAAFAPAAKSAPATPGAALVQAGPFTLRTVDGAVLDELSLDGAPYGVMFGFTHCPDVCPTALAELTTAFAASPNLPKSFKVYFVATDVERDTPAELRAFLSAFDPRIVGLTGSAGEIFEATRAFGAVANRRDFKDGAYAMEHTAALFLVDANGVIADRVSFSAPAEDMAKRIAAVAGG